MISRNLFKTAIPLNHGGKALPRIGLGTDRIRDPAIIAGAIREADYRLIDTASKYGTEGVVGDAVKSCIDEGVVTRDEMFIITKIWNNEYQDPEKALRDSLKRLKLDYVDLYLIHWPATGFFNPKMSMYSLWR